MVQKWYTFDRNYTRNFDLFLRTDQYLAQYCLVTPDSTQSVMQSQPFYIQKTIVFFTFSTVFNKLRELANTFYYQISFVLEDFVQL